jgi:hypothetical protein
MPLRLSDGEIQIVRTAGAQLPLRLRSVFLQMLAKTLGDDVGGDGRVQRVAHKIVRML